MGGPERISRVPAVFVSKTCALARSQSGQRVVYGDKNSDLRLRNTVPNGAGDVPGYVWGVPGDFRYTGRPFLLNEVGATPVLKSTHTALWRLNGAMRPGTRI